MLWSWGSFQQKLRRCRGCLSECKEVFRCSTYLVNLVDWNRHGHILKWKHYVEPSGYAQLLPHSKVLQGRVRRCVYTVGSAVVEPLLRSFKVLSAPPVQKRPVLPNVIGARLVVGHQGHAAKLDEWSKHLDIIGVINLAPNVVPSKLDAIPDRAFYHEVWHSDAMPLWDTADDGRRLCDVLPETLAVIDRALGANPSGRVFIHCQQGRGAVLVTRKGITGVPVRQTMRGLP